MGRRKRSISGNSHKDMLSATATTPSTGSTKNHHLSDSAARGGTAGLCAAKDLLETLLQLRDPTGKSFLHDCCDNQRKQQQRHHNAENSLLSLASGLLTRAQQVDSQTSSDAGSSSSSRSASNAGSTSFLRRFLLQRDVESGYTPLHAAIHRGDIAFVLLFLRTALLASSGQSHHDSSLDSFSPRLTQRPMMVLQQMGPSASATAFGDSLVHALVTATDEEGFTAADLLAAQQRRELLACRLSLPRAKIYPSSSSSGNAGSGRRRTSSFDFSDQNQDSSEDHQNEFDLLSRHLPVLPHQVADGDTDDTTTGGTKTYGCEVITFGPAHHCALGVSTNTSSVTATTISTTKAASSKAAANIRPQRVLALAPRPGQKQGAVAVAAAAHHTLVVMGNSGHLYAFGLGRGGRLGTGHETPCPTPTRILGALQGRVVVGVAAAENHSLAVTKCGYVYAWGSNRFGQVGIATTTTRSGGSSRDGGNDDSSSGGNMRLVPRRVDDLKNVHCVAVAAGEKHSVALSNQGQVYVWGDNTAGQLGICRRSGTHKVQRVEALWNNNKACIAIAASEQATLVLAIPDSSRGRRGNLALPVNSVYSWGHGSHVPSRVHFERETTMSTTNSTKPAKPINPVAIACARFHNVAITSDGEVYSWGLHAEPLGTKKSKKSSTHPHHPNNNNTSLIVASPQLVKGMLPENGGGIAVSVSACENHTAVLTDPRAGALYTWGSTHEKNILGHEGVSWQPDPKRVPGVHRAVGLAVAKEHTVLLVGTTSPPIPTATTGEATETAAPHLAAASDEESTAAATPLPTQPPLSLEDLAARKVAEYVDLFNVMPVLITAERTNCSFLVDFCMEFVRCNLDGVLNVGQKSVLNTYLNEQLRSSLLMLPIPENRDAHLHPLLSSVVTAAVSRGQDSNKPTFVLEQSSVLSSCQEWFQGCESLVQEPYVANMVVRSRQVALQNRTNSLAPRVRSHSSSSLTPTLSKRDLTANAAATSHSKPLESSEELLAEMSSLENMDLSTKAKAETQQRTLAKELRGTRKRLGQISKLQETASSAVALSIEQRKKVSRKPHLEAYLQALEPALAIVEKKLIEFVKEAQTPTPIDESIKANAVKDGEKKEEDPPSEPTPSQSLRCDVCGITCPDSKSHTLHLSGRKHRNRVAQVKEEEQKKTAELMMEEQQRQLLLGQTMRSEEKPVKKGGSAWGGAAGDSSRRQSTAPGVKFKLPPPPHGTPESMVTKSRQPPQEPPKATKPSLMDIMAEEKSRTSTIRKPTKSPMVTSKPSPAKIPAFTLSLPAGSAPALKSPPWATTRPRPSVNQDSSPSTNSLSLGDFVVKPSKPAATGRRRSSSGASWGSPKPAAASSVVATTVGAAASATTPTKRSLLDIQQQEQDFQDKEDQTYASNGKWFIERRERANSFREIENHATKEREDRLFVEEQFRIEKMIQAGQEKAKEEGDAKKNSRGSGKKGRNNRSRKDNRSRSKKNRESNDQQRKNKAAPKDQPTTATTMTPQKKAPGKP